MDSLPNELLLKILRILPKSELPAIGTVCISSNNLCKIAPTIKHWWKQYDDAVHFLNKYSNIYNVKDGFGNAKVLTAELAVFPKLMVTFDVSKFGVAALKLEKLGQFREKEKLRDGRSSPASPISEYNITEIEQMSKQLLPYDEIRIIRYDTSFLEYDGLNSSPTEKSSDLSWNEGDLKFRLIIKKSSMTIADILEYTSKHLIKNETYLRKFNIIEDYNNILTLEAFPIVL